MRFWWDRVKQRWLSGLWVFLWLVVGYFSLQYLEIRPIWWLETEWEDRHIPIHSWAIWPYLSYFLMVPLAGITIRDRDFSSFIRSAFWIASISFLIFALVPTGLARGSIEEVDFATAYHWFLAIDQPRNACPSLHVSLACLSAIFWTRLNQWVGTLAWLWALAISWSAVSLRQHVWPDVVLGAGLALIVCWLVIRLERAKGRI